MMWRCRVNAQTADIASGVHVDKKKVQLLVCRRQNISKAVKTFAKELMASEDATQVLQLETGEAEGPTYSPFQKSARAGLQTTTHFKRAVCLVRAAGLPHLRHHEVWFCTGDGPSPKGFF